jgi:hypothetical protein
MNSFDSRDGQHGIQRTIMLVFKGISEKSTMEKNKAYLKPMFQKPGSPKDEFAQIMTDSQVFKCAVLTRKLNKLIPGLNAFDSHLPEKAPNIYRPMPLMEHTYESIHQAFGLVGNLGAAEYQSDDAKNSAMLWINAALLFHDLGETALIKGTSLPIWYDFAVKWSNNKSRNVLILKETYPFFNMDTPEARNYIGHLIHPEISALLANDFLSRLGWNFREITIVKFLIRNQSVLIEKATYGRTKDGRTIHGDFYEDIDSVEKETGIPKEDLLKMLQVLQLADANAVRPGMAQISQVTRMRVWMAYDYMMFVLLVRSSPARYQSFMHYRNVFNRIRLEKPFGTPFEALFRELLGRIEKEEDGKESRMDEEEKRILEQHLEYYEKFRIIKEDHIHSNDQFNRLLHLVEAVSGKKLDAKDKALLLTAYKIAYRSHDGHSRGQLKTVPVGDVRRKFIEHPIRAATIMIEVFSVTDPIVLAALLLHDVLEDTDTTLEDILVAFRKYDNEGRIARALEILTRPAIEGIKLQPQLLQEIDYLQYVAGTLTAGNKILPDTESFEWQRIVVALAKATDKIHNRRTLIGRRPKGRIEEICRNANVLLMFMEASALTPEQKLKLLEEFSKSLLEMFDLFDFNIPENESKFLELLETFSRKTIYDKSSTRFCSEKSRQRLDEFAENTIRLFVNALQDPSKDIRGRLLQFEKQSLPEFLLEMQLDENEKASIMDAFSLFLFSVSEVAWIKGIQNMIGFPRIVREYRKKIEGGDWKPMLPGIIEELARYAIADLNIPPPLLKYGGKSDHSSPFPTAPDLNSGQDLSLLRNEKRREFVAGLLPRVAMLPLKHILYLEDDEVKSIAREAIEDRIGGIAVSRQPDGRLVLDLQNGIAESARLDSNIKS